MSSTDRATSLGYTVLKDAVLITVSVPFVQDPGAAMCGSVYHMIEEDVIRCYNRQYPTNDLVEACLAPAENSREKLEKLKKITALAKNLRRYTG